MADQDLNIGQEIDRGTKRLTALLETLIDLTSVHELPVLLEAIVERATDLTGAAGGLLYLCDPEHQMLHCVVSHHPLGAYSNVSLKYGEGAAGIVAETGQPLFIEDYHTWEGRALVYEDELVHAVLSAPMIWREKTTGVIQVFHQEAQRKFTPDDLDILTMFARQAAVAVENARLHAETQQRAIKQEALYRIIASAFQSNEIAALVRTALDQTTQALGITIGLGEIEGKLVLSHLPPDAGEALSREIIKVISEMKTLMVIGDREEISGSKVALARLMERTGIDSAMIAPIWIKARPAGFLCLADGQPRRWTQDQRAFLEAVSSQLSTAVERIRYVQEIQETAEKMDGLASISEQLNCLWDYKQVLNLIGEGAKALADTPRVSLFLRHPGGQVEPAWFEGVSQAYVERVARREMDRKEPLLLSLKAPCSIHLGSHRSKEVALAEMLEAKAFHSISLWPLILEGEVSGVLACFYDIPHPWSGNEKEFMQAFTRQATVALRNAQLCAQLEDNYLQAALNLAMMIERREAARVDNRQIAQWAEEIARELRLSSQEQATIRWAALLHDVGKRVVPESLLQKTEALTEDEWALIRQTPLEGERMIEAIPSLREAARLVRHFRERYDGSGYPDGLRGEQIPLGARILAVVDAYCAMVDTRPYKPPRSPQEAILELKRCAGRQFDPRVVSAFLRAAGRRLPLQ